MVLLKFLKLGTATLIAALVVLIGALLLAPLLPPPQINETAGPLRKLYGREKIQNELVKALDEFIFVSVCGVPGVGKSVLVENVANIFWNRSYTVRIIDMLDSKFTNVSALIKHLYTIFNQVEGADDERKLNGERISEWRKDVASFEPILLVLDNLDREWIIHHDTLHDLLIQPLLKSKVPSKLKVIATSRQCFELKGLHHNVARLPGISNSSCADWISKDHAVISYSNSTHLCHILGGVPMAVKLVATFISNPFKSHEYTPESVISKLNSLKFGIFEYLISHNIISEGSSLVNALFLVYDSLEIKYRSCIYFLATTMTFNNINRLSHEHIVSSLESEGEIFANECIEKLLILSLMEKVSHSNEYQFSKFIVGFILWLEEPKADDTFKRIARRYWGNAIKQYVKEQRMILNKKRSIQLATQIGSNKELINSFLPLLGKNYTLMPLFKHALKIIEEQFCDKDVMSPFSGQNASDLIFAYSRLTNVVHCPEYHTTSLLMKSGGQANTAHSSDSCTNTCSRYLMKCGERLKELFYRCVQLEDGIKVIEAFAHYNALLLRTSSKTEEWKSFLFDMAMIIVTANSQCEIYCKRIGNCSCGSQSPFELGLFAFLINKDNLSKHYLQNFLVQQTTDEYQCQMILKTLAIMTIHVINEKSGRDAQLDSVEYLQKIGINHSQLHLTCYLGIIEDTILPFLKEVHPNQSTVLTLAMKHHDHVRRELEFEHGTDADAHPLSRYIEFCGLSALQTTELQKEFKWPDEIELIEPREAWVCSIIKDKTRKCPNTANLPLLDRVRSIEGDRFSRMFKFTLKFLMEEEEFSKWHERVKYVSWFVF